MNANELSKKLELDYKTVRHHLKVLEKNSLISSMGKGYAKMYYISEFLEQHMDILDDIWVQIGKNKINKKRMV